MLSDEVIDFANRSVLCWLATVNESGQPNVSPKEIFDTTNDGRIIIANIASPQSFRNIELNPRVCVSFIDIFIQKGFKLIGQAINIRKDEEEFDQLSEPLLIKSGNRFKIKGIFVVKVEKTEPILAPSYRFYKAETTEHSQVNSAMSSYGVKPIFEKSSF